MTHLSSILRRYGLKSIEGWPGFCYKTMMRNDKRASVMIVTYVDDLIMIGVDLVPGLLEALRKEIDMEDPRSIWVQPTNSALTRTPQPYDAGSSWPLRQASNYTIRTSA